MAGTLSPSPHRTGEEMGERKAWLVLEVEGDGARDPRSLAVGAVVHPRRNVAHVVLHHPHAHGGRTLAHHADDVDLLGGDPPDILAELDPLLLRHPEGLLPLLHELLHPR